MAGLNLCPPHCCARPQDLSAAVIRNEPRNAHLCYVFAKPFGRLAGADPQQLSITSLLAERAVQLKPQHTPYVSCSGNTNLIVSVIGEIIASC